MKSVLTVFWGVVILLMFGVRAHAAEVTFDSFADGQYPGAYAGFTWGSNIATESAGNYAGRHTGAFAFPSSPIAVYNTHGDSVATVTSAGSLDFNGAYFSGWYNDLSPATSITMNGYLDATPVGSVTYAIGNGFSWCEADFKNVNRIEFVSSGGWWLMDNFKYNEPIAATPEPLSMGLFLLGGGTLAIVRRNRRK